MNSIYGAGANAGPFGQTSTVVIPQLTIPNGIQRFEPITAKGRDAAYKMYTPPGVRVPIFDEEEPVFYYKETDQAGNIIAFDTYDYTKREEPKPPEYLTVDMFNAFVSEFNKFKEDVTNAQSIRSQELTTRPVYNYSSTQQPKPSDSDSK